MMAADTLVIELEKQSNELRATIRFPITTVCDGFARC